MERILPMLYTRHSNIENHPKLSWLKYPYLPSHPQFNIAKKQMKNGGGIFCLN